MKHTKATEELIRIELTYNQFIDAITSGMNTSGVPCTIKHFNGKIVPQIDPIIFPKVIVFNEKDWQRTGDLPEGNHKFYQEAIVINLRYRGEWIVDVVFDNGETSHGHFLRCVKPKKKQNNGRTDSNI